MSNKHAKNDHPVHSLIKERWSPRVFDERPLEQEKVNSLFEAARWAASSMNEQPWRFIYAHRGRAAYDKIVDCLMEFNQGWAPNAPLLVLTAYKEKFDSGKDNFHALHDLGLAVGNLSLQAQSLGLALHQMAGLDWKRAQEVFEVTEGFHITTCLAIGYYGGNINKLNESLQESENAPRTRKPLGEIAFEEGWK